MSKTNARITRKELSALITAAPAAATISTSGTVADSCKDPSRGTTVGGKPTTRTDGSNGIKPVMGKHIAGNVERERARCRWQQFNIFVPNNFRM